MPLHRVLSWAELHLMLELTLRLNIRITWKKWSEMASYARFFPWHLSTGPHFDHRFSDRGVYKPGKLFIEVDFEGGWHHE